MNELAGKPAPPELLISTEKLLTDYLWKYPDLYQPDERVAFGTSGHRGTPLDGSFTQAHIRAIVQAVVDYRREKLPASPEILFLGKDTHFISDAAHETALEVLAANGVRTGYQSENRYTPTPVISHRILTANKQFGSNYCDGLILTPSHNPPSDGGIKYNPSHGGAADTEVTKWIEERANQYLRGGNRNVQTLPLEEALQSPVLEAIDYRFDYIDDLVNIIDIEAIRQSGIRIGADPLGGAAIEYWALIAERLGLPITIVNDKVDPTFSFMSVDHDGKIRMDCSSPWSMTGLVALKDRFDLAFGNDPDSDRHGIVSPAVGLMNPNHFLAVAIDYLLSHRPEWGSDRGIGKTLVSSNIIDRVVAGNGRKLLEVPVGFKWFVAGLFDGSIAFGGEESAGASFLRKDGTVWTTDKDGIIVALLAAEIIAKTGIDPGIYYQNLGKKYGFPVYKRVDQVASAAQREAFKHLTADRVKATRLAGEPITAKLTHAPGNGAAIGGLKVVTANGWFAARPSGTENIYKIYAESFLGEEHLDQILQEATVMVQEGLDV